MKIREVEFSPDLTYLHKTARMLCRRGGNLIKSTQLMCGSDADCDGNENEDVLSRTTIATSSSEHVGRNEEAIRAGVLERQSSMEDKVREAYKSARDLVLRKIHSEYPTHRIIEDWDNCITVLLPDDRQPTWIVDVINGKTNLAQDIPYCCISIAFANCGHIFFGVIYNPFTNELFSAIRGQGAFLNNNRIHVDPCNRLSNAIILHECFHSRNAIGKIAEINKKLMVNHHVKGLRQYGCTAMDLCYVAKGRAHAVYGGVGTDDRWNLTDCAAGVVIAEEAGARLSSTDGEPFTAGSGNILCATPGIVAELSMILF